MNKINTALVSIKIRKELGKLPLEYVVLIQQECKRYLERKNK